MNKKTKIKGKVITHPEGYLAKGILIGGTAYPVFKKNQASPATWGIVKSLSSSGKANGAEELKKILVEALGRGGNVKNAYIKYNRENLPGVPLEVIETAFDLANSDIAVQQVPRNGYKDGTDFYKAIRDKGLRIQAMDDIPLGEIEAPDESKATAKAKSRFAASSARERLKDKMSDTLKEFDDDDTLGQLMFQKKEGTKIMIPKLKRNLKVNPKKLRGRTRSRSPPPQKEGRPPSKLRGGRVLASSVPPPQESKAPAEEYEAPDPVEPDVPEPDVPFPDEAPPGVGVSQRPKESETSDQIQSQLQDRLQETEGTAGLDYSRREDEGVGLDMDKVEDTGIHNEAIQKIATANDYDFSFTKQSLLSVNPLPDDKATLRKMGEKCIREFGYLLNILKPKDNYSKREVEELYTLKHILKQVIRLEAGYKRAILKLRIGGQGSGSGLMDGGLGDLMANGKLGLVLNSGSLNLSPQQVIQGATQGGGGDGDGLPVPPVQGESKEGAPPEQQQQPAKPTVPPVDIFKELNKKKTRRRVSLQMRRKPKKAVFKQNQIIVMKGRVIADVDYQNLRSEAERINQAPIPLLFKSRTSTLKAKKINRFSVNY